MFRSLIAAFILIGSSAHADLSHTQMICHATDGKHLMFTISFATHTISFDVTEAFDHSQILDKTPFAYDDDGLQSSHGIKLDFSYDWYYTANYTLQFNKSLWKLKQGDDVFVELSGYDDDGPSGIDSQLQCSVLEFVP